MRTVGLLLVLAPVAVAGCTPAQERFETEDLADLCGQASQCSRSYPPESCLETLRTDLVERECRFSDANARACADEIAGGLECATDRFGTSRLVVGTGCRATYDCRVGPNWLDAMLGPAQ